MYPLSRSNPIVELNMVEVQIKKNAKAKGLRLSVRVDGTCVVTVPRRVPKFFVKRFIESRRAWIEAKVAEMKRKHPEASKLDKTAKTNLYKLYKEAALKLATNRLEHFNQHYNFTYKRITIRNQQTRWGSCSSKGNLNFSYRIMLLTPEQADYIIVHELCHLGEMNHSAKFWKLVERTVPEYKAIRRSIRGVLA